MLAQNTGVFPSIIFYMKGKFVLKRERYKYMAVTVGYSTLQIFFLRWLSYDAVDKIIF